MKLTQPCRVHFVGIGGAGMSAIAKILIERGFGVSGSDLKQSRGSTMLEAIGAKVSIGHDAGLVDDADVVVVSSAISRANVEYLRAEEQGIEVISRGAALAQILQDMRSIVISGTHGKTTTTSMVATVLRTSGLDPTYLIGAGLNDAGTNARTGATDLAVAESDESDGSFLLLAPYVAVVTNIELDHVDHWASMDDLRAAFERFISSGPPDGIVVVPSSEEKLVRIAGGSGRRVITFGDGGDVRGETLGRRDGGVAFTLTHGTESVEIHLSLPGAHNVENAMAAAAACLAVGIPLDEIAEGLNVYRGVERRFQTKGTARGIVVIDDYAHHPTEIAATLAAARDGAYERIVAVFQPHRYSRTAALATEFGSSFEDADEVVLMDVYGAGEDPLPGVSGQTVADAVLAASPEKPVGYFAHRQDVLEHLVRTGRAGDAVFTLGAGDVTTVGDELLGRLEGGA